MLSILNSVSNSASGSRLTATLGKAAVLGTEEDAAEVATVGGGVAIAPEPTCGNLATETVRSEESTDGNLSETAGSGELSKLVEADPIPKASNALTLARSSAASILDAAAIPLTKVVPPS